MTATGAITRAETEGAVGGGLCVPKWSWVESCVKQNVLSDHDTPFSLWPLDNDTVEIVEKESVRQRFLSADAIRTAEPECDMGPPDLKVIFSV